MLCIITRKISRIKESLSHSLSLYLSNIFVFANNLPNILYIELLLFYNMLYFMIC